MIPAPPKGAWAATAACTTAPNPEVFYAEAGTQAEHEALAICATCPVTAECLAWIMDYEARVNVGETRIFRDGVWGATTPSQRAALA